MSYRRRTPLHGGLHPLLSSMGRLAAAAAAVLFFSLAAMPAFAHDDDGPAAPPTAEAQAAATRWTVGTLSLVAGVGVYYLMQRNRLMNSSQHPPEWEQKMNRNSILFAVVAAVVVGGVVAAMSRPAPIASGYAPVSPAPPPPVMQPTPGK